MKQKIQEYCCKFFKFYADQLLRITLVGTVTGSVVATIFFVMYIATGIKRYDRIGTAFLAAEILFMVAFMIIDFKRHFKLKHELCDLLEANCKLSASLQFRTKCLLQSNSLLSDHIALIDRSQHMIRELEQDKQSLLTNNQQLQSELHAGRMVQKSLEEELRYYQNRHK